MNTRTATRTEAPVLIRALALVIAERDGLHPIHAVNRVRAACALVDACEHVGNPSDVRGRVRMAERAGVQASAATWDLAEVIYNAEMEVL